MKNIEQKASEFDSIPNEIKIYLDEIKDRLESKHASVMVGAGFSKNAEPVSSDCDPFPDWNKLGDIFCGKIGVEKNDEKYLDILKLADEVEALFGRKSLHQLLHESIPDKEYNPSDFHKKLIELPWNNVFTTNYDTLLERACENSIKRRYDVVLKTEDLVHSSTPRIIKLHGSFPSTTPFIITKEDYRTYPKKFAPFVNAVQESLIENTFCLIGFSGDDPNFLQWLGWIRDNLGDNKAPIYLISITKVSNYQIEFLKKNGITVIDLSKLENVEDDYSGRLEIFLNYLKIDYSQQWPSKTKIISPSILANGEYPNRKEETRDIIHEWETQRKDYPGWVVVPHNMRERLWDQTMHWMSQVSEHWKFNNLYDLKFAFELNWRLTLCLSIIYNNQEKFFEKIADKYLEDNAVSEDEMISFQLDKRQIKEMCIQLLLSLLRHYRQKGELENWKSINGKLVQNKKFFSAEQIDQWHYEQVLNAIFGIDGKKIQTELKNWKTDNSLFLWKSKKAMLLAEFGTANDIEHAKNLLESSLRNVRANLNLKPISRDSFLISQEAYILLFLRIINSLNFFSKEDEEWKQRKETFKGYNCDPFDELNFFDLLLNKPKRQTKTVKVEHGFDLFSKTISANSSGYDKDLYEVCSYLNFLEETGIPFRIGWMGFFSKNLQNILSYISLYSSYWSTALVFRSKNLKLVDCIYDREAIGKLSISNIDEYINKYLEILTKTINDVSRNSSQYNDYKIKLIKIILQIISRLSCRCSEHLRDKIWNVIFSIWQALQQENIKNERHWIKRLTRNLAPQKCLDIIPQLLELPFPQNVEEKDSFVNPISFITIGEQKIQKLKKPIIPSITIEKFIDMIGSKDKTSKQYAIGILKKLHRLGLLNVNQETAYFSALWNHCDISSGEVSFSLLYELPHKGYDILEKFRDFINNQKFPILKDRSKTGVELHDVWHDSKLYRELVCAAKCLKQSDIISLLEQLFCWWEKDKDYLKWESTSSSDFALVSFGTVRERICQIPQLLSNVVLPRFNKKSFKKYENRTKDIVKEFSDYGLPALQLRAVMANVLNGTDDQLLKDIDFALRYDDEENLEDALDAILILLGNNMFQKKSLELTLDKVIQRYFWRKKIGITAVINTIYQIVDQYPECYTKKLEWMVLEALIDIAKNKISDFDFNESLELRCKSAQLASRLYLFYQENKRKIPDEILKWEKICNSEDEFVEVKNQWIG